MIKSCDLLNGQIVEARRRMGNLSVFDGKMEIFPRFSARKVNDGDEKSLH
jgi:hypothetical protein